MNSLADDALALDVAQDGADDSTSADAPAEGDTAPEVATLTLDASQYDGLVNLIKANNGLCLVGSLGVFFALGAVLVGFVVRGWLDGSR